MTSIFTKIIKQEISSYKIVENERFYAFLDISPLTKGHTLVITKLELDYIFDLEDSLLAEMIVFSKQIAQAIQKHTKCNRVGVMVIGLEVPHAHIHLVPIESEVDMMLSNDRLELEASEFESIAKGIARHLSIN